MDMNRPPLIVEPEALRGLTKHLGGTDLHVSDRVTSAQIAEVIHIARDGRTVIIAASDLGRNTNQLELVQELVDRSIPVIVLISRNPFDAVLLPDGVTIVIAYGLNPPTREALAEVLAGNLQPTGVLPVELP